MNLTNIVQEYKKLLTLEDYYNYKFDPRMKSRRKPRNGFSTRPVPEYNESDVDLLHPKCKDDNNNALLMSSDTFSKTKHVISHNNNDNDNILTTTTNALHLYTKDNGQHSQPKLSYAALPVAPIRGIGIANTKCRHKRLCKGKCCGMDGNDSGVNVNVNDATNREKLVKKVRYSVNNFPCVTLGTYGQISSVEGIKTYCDTSFINKKMKEELYEYNERITPLFKIRKYEQYDDNVKYVERFKIKDIQREFKNPKDCYVVTKPYFPLLRGKLNMNNVVKRKTKAAKVVRKKGWLQVVPE